MMTPRTLSERTLVERERNALMRLRAVEDRNARLEEKLEAVHARKSLNWNIFIPVFVAVIGATASILGTAYSQFLQADLAAEEARAAQELQALIAQQELIKIAVGAEEERADLNIRFLVASDLVPAYAEGLKAAIEAGQSLSTPPPQPAPAVQPVSVRHPDGGYVRSEPVSRITVHDTGADRLSPLDRRAYNYVIGRDGRVADGIPEERAPVCVARMNQGTLCIALVGRCWQDRPDKNEPYTDAQLAALERLVREKLEQFDLTPEDVYTRQGVTQVFRIPSRPKCTRLEGEIDAFRARLGG